MGGSWCAKACFSQAARLEARKRVCHKWKHHVPTSIASSCASFHVQALGFFCAGARGLTHDPCAYKAHALPTEPGGFNFCSKPRESRCMASSRTGNISCPHRFQVYLAGFGLGSGPNVVSCDYCSLQCMCRYKVGSVSFLKESTLCHVHVRVRLYLNAFTCMSHQQKKPLTIAAGELQKRRISDGGGCSFHAVVFSTILSQLLAAQFRVDFEWGPPFLHQSAFQTDWMRNLFYPCLSIWVYFVPLTRLLHCPLNIDKTLHPILTAGGAVQQRTPPPGLVQQGGAVGSLRSGLLTPFHGWPSCGCALSLLGTLILILWHCLIAGVIQLNSNGFKRVFINAFLAQQNALNNHTVKHP